MAATDPSRWEKVRDLLVEHYQGITVANGYRQTILKVDGSNLDIRDTTQFPMIQVSLWDETTELIDGNSSIGDIYSTVYVLGHIKGALGKMSTNPEISNLQNEIYKMKQDLWMRTAELAILYVNDPSKPFVLNFDKKPIKFEGTPDFTNQLRVYVVLSFGIIMKNVLVSNGA